MQSRTRQRMGEAGVTLVEILVVLSIIAITTGAAMLRLGIGNGRDQLANTAAATALAITGASDAALASGRDRLIEFGADGYRITTDSGGGDWNGMPGVDITSVEGQTGPRRLPADGSSPPFRLRLTAAGQNALVRFDGLTAKVEGAP
ncbi:MAG: prepilin-type N-terminal cleavage/methylation domain-containing protein [Paracoccaceae bacterium]